MFFEPSSIAFVPITVDLGIAQVAHTPSFNAWGASHWGVLSFLGLSFVALYFASRCGLSLHQFQQSTQSGTDGSAALLSQTRWQQPLTSLLRRVLAWVLLLSWPVELVWVILSGQELEAEKLLPLHLCDVASFVAGWSLLSRSPWGISLSIYWGMTLTLQALLTPDIEADFPNAHFFFFFGSHLLVVLAALWLRTTLQGALPRGAWWRVALVSQSWFALAILVNTLTGSNFGYLAGLPDNPSLLDHLGAWPWYLLSMNALCVTCWFLISFLLESRNLRWPQARKN